MQSHCYVLDYNYLILNDLTSGNIWKLYANFTVGNIFFRCCQTVPTFYFKIVYTIILHL